MLKTNARKALSHTLRLSGRQRCAIRLGTKYGRGAPSHTLRVTVGDTISIPGIGDVEVVANDSIAEGVETGDVNNGVVLLPERVVFTAENMDQYDF